ncbi:MAG: polymer-forming cytoskeletal protein [Alphaproteobacteria bacterium]|nr:polymer-forming cytoskeletal protein [Alphaproteobacteria bacterium]
MSADTDQDDERSDLDLSFLDRQPVRAADIPNLNDRGERSDDPEPRMRGGGPDAKTLTVARDIALKGDITECDSLVVEGRIDATLNEARALEIARGGRFTGTARVQTATISGRFDGDLDVARELRITASGKVTGNVTYGRLEIEQGGEVLGDVKIHA